MYPAASAPCAFLAWSSHSFRGPPLAPLLLSLPRATVLPPYSLPAPAPPPGPAPALCSTSPAGARGPARGGVGSRRGQARETGPCFGVIPGAQVSPHFGSSPRASSSSTAGGEGLLGTMQPEGTAVESASGGGATGLAKEKCIPCHNKSLQPLPRDEADALLQQEVPSWQVVDVEGALRLRRTWKTRNFLTGLEFFQRISEIAEAEGHHPDLHLEGWNNARVEVFTHSIGGLHKNDFILAAKIDALDVADLMRKPKKSIS